GLGNYLVPLMIGARDMAFPRLNALSYWFFLLGGIVLYASWFSAGGAARAGWYSYPPLSEHAFEPGKGQDLWILAIHLTSFSSIAIGFYSMLVWAHHMFSVGMPTALNIFFMLSSMTIAVPTGIKILNWIATTWRGNVILDTPMLFALGAVGVFTIGGLSGVM